MKKLIAMLAVVAVAPLAQADTDFSWNGESRARFDHQENTAFTESSAQETVVHRTKLGLTAKASESWTGKVTLLHNYDFGVDATDSATDDSAGGTPDAVIDDNLLLVNEAYFNWMLNDSWTLQVGRRGLHWADGSVLARNDYESTPTAWDGASVIWDHDMFAAEFTWNKVEDSVTGTGVPSTDPETTFWGVGVNFKGLGDWLKTTHVHLLKQQADETDDDVGSDLLRYGVTLGGGAMGIWYNATYAGYSGDLNGAGTVTDASGSLMDFTVGYGMDAWGVHARYHVDSGDSDSTDTDFEQYTDLASEKHGQAGLMDILAWGNLTFINAGATYAFNDGKCKVALNYWIFTQTEKGDSSFIGVNGGGLDADSDGDVDTSVATEDALGSEIDVEFTHTFDNNFELLARVGMFSPGDEFGTSDETATQYFLQGRMPF